MIGQPGAADAARRLAPVVRLAPAKLNLTLAVLGRNRDGHHDLHSIMVPLDLADVLTLARAPAGDRHAPRRGPRPRAGGRQPHPPGDRRDAPRRRRRAGSTWAAPRRAGRGTGAGAGVRLEKRIPVAAGLGGGSSDAAAAVDGGARGVGGGDRSTDPARDRGPPRIGRPVLPRRRAGPRRGPRRALHAPRRRHGPTAGRAPRDAVGRGLDGRGLRGVRRRRRPARSRRDRRTLGPSRRPRSRAACPAARLVERAGVLAVGQRPVPATAAVVPEIVGVRRSLARLLGRPIGQSGSGPTAWALYPSPEDAADGAELVRAAVRDGTVTFPGGAPSIIATTLATAAADHDRQYPRREHDPRRDPHDRRTGGHRAVQPGHLHREPRVLFRPDRPRSDDRRARRGRVEAQAERALPNLTAVLDAGGCTWADVVKTTLFLADIADFAAVNAIYGKRMPDPPPARSTFAVGALPKGARIEIEATAIRRLMTAQPTTRLSRTSGRPRRQVPGRPPGRPRGRSKGATEDDLDALPAAPDTWTARMVVHHLADSEMMSAMRLRRLIAEEHRSSRATTNRRSPAASSTTTGPSSRRSRPSRPPGRRPLQILDRLTDAQWAREGIHTESGRYGVEDWLQIYAAHAHEHADQIRRAISVGRAAGGPASC